MSSNNSSIKKVVHCQIKKELYDKLMIVAFKKGLGNRQGVNSVIADLLKEVGELTENEMKKIVEVDNED